ncbi:MAG TPA: co-chaperone GroES [Candidatus Syntrophosphaera sp.]|jgi:chaperonin GroES|nr:co-chaperone GroES [Candidatus Cloacimonadota bacterium]OQB92007.1 MAG: 10 kDa chaperonin 3 [Candidatus Cloacimonetes bacterium ADurb.Bin117]HNU54694.1 co-chaperone GroES [Candidatus Syntrophosphaera sp.]NLH93209.1 co-chaperone GroES [Candidatus Cloacimonadota bacterium]HOH47816.1 co-chaperone GroES [Candidatus Syntrophosphaera sp.]
MKLRPIEEHLVVKPDSAIAEKTVGGIIIPDTAKEKPQIAEVIAVGTDEDLQKIVKVGDRVLFGKYSGTEIEIEGEKLLILSKDDILAIVE